MAKQIIESYRSRLEGESAESRWRLENLQKDIGRLNMVMSIGELALTIASGIEVTVNNPFFAKFGILALAVGLWYPL